jgi:hypothetical protein
MEVIFNAENIEQLKLYLKKCVKEATEEVLKEKLSASHSDWITIEEAMKLLPYKSKTTWQKLRDSGTIEISQAPGSRNILYSKKSIQNYLNKDRMNF